MPNLRGAAFRTLQSSSLPRMALTSQKYLMFHPRPINLHHAPLSAFPTEKHHDIDSSGPISTNIFEARVNSSRHDHQGQPINGLSAASCMQSGDRPAMARVLIMIDEVHNLLAGTHHELRRFLNVLRYLSNELEASLV